MKRLTLLLVVVCAIPSFAQTGWRYDNMSFYNSSGYAKVIPYAHVRACANDATAGTSATPCGTAIQAYGDAALSVPLTTPNFLGDADGNFYFYLAAGIYKVSVCGATKCKNLTDVVIGSLAAGATAPIISAYVSGGQPSSGVPIILYRAPATITIPSGCTNSHLEVMTAPTSTAVFNLKKCTGTGFSSCTVVGTATITAGEKAASFSCIAPIALTANVDALVLTAPSPSDATLKNVGIAIYASNY